jgi:hypothetical protein
VFEFSLRPVDEIQPWGELSPVLHWFGLSDGNYFVDAKGEKLLAYAPRPNWPQYVDYQVARLHEDVLEILPQIIDAVPADVARLLAKRSLLAMHRDLWRKADHADDDELLEALEGFRLRTLDTLYLSPGADIAFWRRDNDIVVEWDNRTHLIDGTPAWTAAFGSISVPVADFIVAVRGFHERFMREMNARVDMICHGNGPPGVHIDLQLLRADQASHERALDAAISRPPKAVSWQSIVDAAG